MQITIESEEEQQLIKELESKRDPDSVRLRRYLAMPDLSRIPGPLAEIVERTLGAKSLGGFDVIKTPEVVPTKILFDLFNMPPGHPARSKSDSYYVNDDYVLRTHDTVFWYYYLNHPEIKKKISRGENLGAVCYGKVYRKDEIDRKHMNVFHQIGAFHLAPDGKRTITPDDLKNTLSEIARSIFGEEVEFRFYEHNFPYTDPSFEMEAKINGEWIEMVGSGMARKSVLANMGLTGYHGWAFGFGMERLAMASMNLPDIRLLWSDDERVKKQLRLGNKYKEVSKYPPITRDISFVVNTDFVPNNYYDLIRELGGSIVEEVKLLDEYEDRERFGAGKKSYTFRIVYRSNERTLLSGEVDAIQEKIYQETARQFGAELR